MPQVSCHMFVFFFCIIEQCYTLFPMTSHLSLRAPTLPPPPPRPTLLPTCLLLQITGLLNFQAIFELFMWLKTLSGLHRTLWRSRALHQPQQWVSMGGLSVSVPPLGCVWGKLQGCYGPINNGFIVWGILMLFTQALSKGFHVCQQQACPECSDA